MKISGSHINNKVQLKIAEAAIQSSPSPNRTVFSDHHGRIDMQEGSSRAETASIGEGDNKTGNNWTNRRRTSKTPDLNSQTRVTNINALFEREKNESSANQKIIC